MALPKIVKLGTVALLMTTATSLPACEEQDKSKEPDAKAPDTKAPPKTAPVTIAGKTFTLELAVDEETRFKGLSGRTEIKADGGMLFVFKEPKMQNFVMRDCLVPIDIIYLDASGRVTAMHKMPIQEPRQEDEKENQVPEDAKGNKYPDMPKWAWSNPKYEKRLKQFSSRYPAQYVIELKGNTLDELKIKEGDKIELDRAALKKLAK